MNKNCYKCNENKPLQLFCKHKDSKDGRSNLCLSCKSNIGKERYGKQLDKIQQQHSVYRIKNKKKIAKLCARWYKKNSNKVLSKQKNNRKHINKRDKKLRDNDPSFRIAGNLRCRIRQALKGLPKLDKFKILTGCSAQQLKEYLESQFEPWMSWENYGFYNHSCKTWHVDHILPCADFDLTDLKEQKLCFHYSNLRPLEAKENLIKGKKSMYFKLNIS